MAKQRSFLKFDGNIGDLNFIQTRDGYSVRQKAHIAKSRIMNDPEFARTRENMAEFTNVQQAGKVFRASQRHATIDVKNGKAANKLSTVLTKIKNLDTSHDRGLRDVNTGILSEDGMAALNGFHFNDKGLLNDVLIHPYTLDTDDGVLTLTALKPKSGIIKPASATRAGFNLFWSKVDFATGTSATETSGETLVNITSDTAANTILTIPSPPVGAGVNVFTLRIVFYQIVNGDNYQLMSKDFSVAAVIAVL